jgi:hypothetical protein
MTTKTHHKLNEDDRYIIINKKNRTLAYFRLKFNALDWWNTLENVYLEELKLIDTTTGEEIQRKERKDVKNM